jgi:hypothetical protein
MSARDHTSLVKPDPKKLSGTMPTSVLGVNVGGHSLFGPNTLCNVPKPYPELTEAANAAAARDPSRRDDNF